MERLRNSIRKCEVFIQKSLSLKKYFERKNSQRSLCYLFVNLPTVKIWGQSDKFPMSFSFLPCPLQVKKLIRENSAKNVNQTGNFYFWPKLKTAISLPIFNIFEKFFLDESLCLNLYIDLKIKISTKRSL